MAWGHVLPFLQIAGNGGEAPAPYQGFVPGLNWGTSVFQITLPHTITEGLCPRQWFRNHRARGRAPTFINSWARITTWGKQETHHSVLPATKALVRMTNCTRRAINLNNFIYKNESGTLVAVGIDRPVASENCPYISLLTFTFRRFPMDICSPYCIICSVTAWSWGRGTPPVLL